MLGLQGSGFIRLASYIVDAYIDRGELVEVLADFRPDIVPVSVLYPTSKHLSPVVRVFVDWVADLFTDAE
jgi:LysR family transcriptional regulator for bpeEF and oprC